MPDIPTIETSDFELSFWCKRITGSIDQLTRTMANRGKLLPKTTLNFTPPVLISGTSSSQDKVGFDFPVFFENKSYELEFVFVPQVFNAFGSSVPKVLHRLKSIEDIFRYNPKTGSLRATLNTGNDIGWFNIDLEYLVKGVIKRQSVSFEVLPVKMDMETDLQCINRDIDAQYPLWRFSLAEKTSQNLQSKRKPNPQFLLLWLAQFESLWDDMGKGLKHIVNAPHSRLLNYSSSVRMDRLKGRLAPQLELGVKEAVSAKAYDKRFVINKKHLSVDTPENRFIKFVIASSAEKLQVIGLLAEQRTKRNGDQHLSDSFLNTLQRWQKSLNGFKNHSLLKKVGAFKGLSRESLVLQQRSGYAKVYKTWQQLKWYLDLLGDDSTLSSRNVAELYEVWCFLQVRNILERIGFVQIGAHQSILSDNGLDVSMSDGLAGAFKFERSDGVKVRLAHEQVFCERSQPIRTWMTSQKPDIVLAATLPNGEEFYWLFDAKYRIDTNEGSLQDLAPDDAINQMHRYRDALIYQQSSSSRQQVKSRPVFGAYILYPGFYNQLEDVNPYQQAIDEVSVGAFSLLPSDDASGCHWLSSFLNEKLGTMEQYAPHTRLESYMVEEAARIAYKGTVVSHYDDLTIIFSGRVLGRNSDYLYQQKRGELTCYHTKRIATDRQEIEQHIIKEVRYLGVAVDDEKGAQAVQVVYPVVNVKLVPRLSLTEQQTGISTFDNPEEDYWFFELGRSISIIDPIMKKSSEHFEVLLTSFDSLDKNIDWMDLPRRYTKLMP